MDKHDGHPLRDGLSSGDGAAGRKRGGEAICPKGTIMTLISRLEQAEADNARLREALRRCRRAIAGGSQEPRRNVREIVDEALGEKTTLGGELAMEHIASLKAAGYE